jgi:hypothetical protein
MVEEKVIVDDIWAVFAKNRYSKSFAASTLYWIWSVISHFKQYPARVNLWFFSSSLLSPCQTRNVVFQ